MLQPKEARFCVDPGALGRDAGLTPQRSDRFPLLQPEPSPGHFEAWRLSELTQRDYCERHGLSLKSFGNWRGQLKRKETAGSHVRWGWHRRLKHLLSPMANPMVDEAADRVPMVVIRTGRRRHFKACLPPNSMLNLRQSEPFPITSPLCGPGHDDAERKTISRIP